MTEHEATRRERLARIRRVRRFLKPLPRRANIARYPIIRWFHEAARRRPYLWSFKRHHVIPAFYVGCVIAFLPLYGVQFLLGFGGALLSRCNLPVTIALQFITNPFTAIPIYGLTLFVGHWFFDLTGLGAPPAEVAEGLLSRAGQAAAALTVGGVIVGLILAVFIDIGYRIALWETERFKARLARAHAAKEGAAPAEPEQHQE